MTFQLVRNTPAPIGIISIPITLIIHFSACMSSDEGFLNFLALAANCFWRLLFMGYLAALVPDWMREVSVLRSSESLVRFLVIDNLCATVVAWVGLQVLSLIRKRMKTKERKVSLPKVQYAVLAVSLMIVADIALQLLMA